MCLSKKPCTLLVRNRQGWNFENGGNLVRISFFIWSTDMINTMMSNVSEIKVSLLLKTFHQLVNERKIYAWVLAGRAWERITSLKERAMIIVECSLYQCVCWKFIYTSCFVSLCVLFHKYMMYLVIMTIHLAYYICIIWLTFFLVLYCLLSIISTIIQ